MGPPWCGSCWTPPGEAHLVAMSSDPDIIPGQLTLIGQFDSPFVRRVGIANVAERPVHFGRDGDAFHRGRVIAKQRHNRMTRFVRGEYIFLSFRQLRPFDPLGHRAFDERDRRLAGFIFAKSNAGYRPAKRVQVVAAVSRATRRADDEIARAFDRVLHRVVGHLQPHFLVVNLQNIATIVRLRIRDVQVKLEASGAEQGRVDRFDEVRRADHEHEFFLAKAVHFGEQLIDHRMFDAATAVGSACGGERVEFVENDDRRGRLPRFVEDLPQVLFALADPLRFEFGAGDDLNRRTDCGGNRLREKCLAGAGWPPEDHAARDQFFEPRDIFGRRCGVAFLQYIEDFLAKAFFDFRVAADLAVEVDVRYLHRPVERA